MADPNDLTAEELKMMEAGEGEEPITEEEPTGDPEPQPAPAVEPPPIPQPKTVPLAALHEAREEIRAMRERLGVVDALKNEFIQLRERLKPAPPTFDTDPKAALEHQFASLKEQISQRDQALQQLAQVVVGRQQTEDLVNNVRMQEQVFRNQQPDYDDAVSFVTDLKARELQSLGINDPVVINQEILKMAHAFTQRAAQTGQNPAEVLYSLARTYGYMPKQVQNAPVQQPAPQVAPQFTAPKVGQERFETIQRGQAATKTLQAGETEAAATVKALYEADDEQFNKLWDQVMKPKKGSY